MISKIQRIPSPLIPQFFRKAKRKENEEFRVYYLKNDFNYCRFAVIISNKVNNKSVLRNKIRRRIKVILKQLEKEKKLLRNNFDLVILVKKIISKDFQSLKENLLSLLGGLN